MNKWSLINADSGEKTWLTPRNIIVSLGHFDTDPCCPPNMPWKTADVMLTKHEDGTLAPWHGRVWLNPPYGRESYPFLERMSKHDGGGIALLFARTDTEIWQSLVFPFAFGILFIRGRLHFHRPDGTDAGSSTAPSVLVAYSEADTVALANSGIKGTLVRLKQNMQSINKNTQEG